MSGRGAGLGACAKPQPEEPSEPTFTTRVRRDYGTPCSGCSRESMLRTLACIGLRGPPLLLEWCCSRLRRPFLSFCGCCCPLPTSSPFSIRWSREVTYVSHDSVRARVLLAEQTVASSAGCLVGRAAGKHLCARFRYSSRPCDCSGDGVAPHTEGGAGSRK